MHMPSNPTIPLLGLYPTDIPAYMQDAFCIGLFISLYKFCIITNLLLFCSIVCKIAKY